MVSRRWQFNPDSGGRPVPEIVRATTRAAVLDHANCHFAGRYREIDVRFRSQFCYVDAHLEPSAPPAGPTPPEPDRADVMELCRLRFFDRDRWSLALYSYATNAMNRPCSATASSSAPRSTASTWPPTSTSHDRYEQLRR